MIKISDINQSDIPEFPGIYIIMQNSKFLYIGKANNLKKRMMSYLHLKDSRRHIRNMMQIATNVNYKTTRTSSEALILENHLINKFKPRFNIKLSFSVNVSYISINFSDSIPRPRIMHVNSVSFGDHITNIGPFYKNILHHKPFAFLCDFFKLHVCKGKGCINCQLNLCAGKPSLSESAQKKYIKQLHAFIKALYNKDSKFAKKLTKMRDDFAKRLQFEDAETVHKALDLVQYSIEISENSDINLYSGNVDVITYKRTDEEDFLFTASFSGHCKLISSVQSNYSFSTIDYSEIVQTIINNYSHTGRLQISKILLHPTLFSCIGQDGMEVIKKHISKNIEIKTPSTKSECNCFRLADIFAGRSEVSNHASWQEVFKSLVDTEIPINKIQSIDISHIGGQAPCGSVVTFINNESVPSEAKIYDLSKEVSRNDVEAIKTVILQHFSEQTAIHQIPEIIIIDGGKGQINAARKAIESLNIIKRPLIISLSKDKGYHGNNLVSETIHTESGRKINLSSKSKTLFALQNMRDFAHNKAKFYTMKKLWKNEKQGLFKNIKGVGSVYQNTLISKFKNLSDISQCTPERLHKITNIPIRVSENIIKYLQNVL